jgi:polysaccharide export outer membrane protein
VVKTMNKGCARPVSGLRRTATCLAIAVAVAGAPAGPSLAGTEAYRMGPGDTLLITAYGDAGLTGQFVVDADGSIGFPLIGNVPVSGLTPAEIGARLNEGIGRYVAGRSISVAVAAYAPILILGDVERPGQYAYHPGMIPLELVAVSGGLRRGKDAVDSAQVQLVAARQEYADLGLQIFSNQVRRARLAAELEGGEFDFQQGDNLDPSEREMRKRLVDRESELFSIRRSNFLAQKAAIENQKQSFRDELKALTERSALYDGELKLLEQDVASTKSLVDRGLTAQSTLRETQRQLSSARRDALELGSFLARARQGELDLAQRQDALLETQRAEAAAGIREIDLDVARKQKQMAAILERMAAVSSSAEALQVRAIKARMAYVIVRQVGDKFVEIAADEFAPLKPRDILRASLVLPDQPPPAPQAANLN